MIKKTIKSFAVLAALAVAFVGFGSFSPNVNAEENIDSDKDGTLTLTPASDRQELKPGQVFNGHFNIVNTGAGPLDFNVYVKPITVDSSCTEQYEVENEYNIMANWTKFEQADFEDIQPGETAKVNFTITVPEDIPSGGQYVVMFAETGTKAEQAEGTSIKVGTRVGYKFFADLGGEDVKEGKITSHKQDNFYWVPPIGSFSTIRNEGNVDFQATNNYIVQDLSGKEVYKNSMTIDVLPNTCRAVTSTWDNAPTLGLFKVTNKIDFLGETQLNETKWVLILPIWFVLVFGTVAILLVCALILTIKKHRNAKKSSRYDKKK